MASKVCTNCGRKYQYQVKLIYEPKTDTFYCLHDNDFVSSGYELSCIKKQREKYAKDIVQPYNLDGATNKDFKKLYPNSEALKR